MNKINFKKDFYTNEDINLVKYRKELEDEFINSNKTPVIYFSTICKKYHEEKYNKKFENIILEFFVNDIPKCPINNLPVKFSLGGQLNFYKFCDKCTKSEIQIWQNKNNSKVLEHHERMKIERKGKGNPCYGKIYSEEERKELGKMIRKATPKRLKTISEWSDEKKDEIKKKQSESAIKSAKNCPNRGMSGKTHSIETRKKLSENTQRMYKEGKFKQTNTYINIFVENYLKELNIEYEKEFGYGHFIFDFKVKEFLIEVQGDYWHCNPEIEKLKDKYKTDKRLQRNFARDKSKRKEVETKNEYKLIEIWENDINKTPEKIKLCLKELLK